MNSMSRLFGHNIGYQRHHGIVRKDDYTATTGPLSHLVNASGAITSAHHLDVRNSSKSRIETGIYPDSRPFDCIERCETMNLNLSAKAPSFHQVLFDQS
jgi:hypothetical protein